MAGKKPVTDVSEHIHQETNKGIVINLVINGAIAYATMHDLTQMSTWGGRGYGYDLITTGFFLCAILAGIFIPLYRSKCTKNEIIPGAKERQALAWLLPYNPWLTVLLIALAGGALAAVILLVLLDALHVELLSPLAYAGIKAVWAAVLAGIVIPIAIRQGLREPPSKD
jgi:hypothetical protein